MAKYVVAFEQWVKDEQLAFVASHYDTILKVAKIFNVPVDVITR